MVFPAPEGVSLEKYDDKSDGGASEATLDIKDSSAKFTCTLGADTATPAWCGLLWNFDPEGKKDYRNWTFVDTIFIDLEATGTKQLLLKVWTFDPDVTDLEKQQTFKLLLKEVPVKPGRQKVALPMEELYTPDSRLGTGARCGIFGRPLRPFRKRREQLLLRHRAVRVYSHRHHRRRTAPRVEGR